MLTKRFTWLITLVLVSMGDGSSMKVSYKSVQLIKRFIAWKSRAYWDSTARQWAIGYGSTRYETGQRVRRDDVIAEYRGYQLLRDRVNGIADQVNALLANSKVTQGQFHALVSFCFDLGTRVLKRSTLLIKVRRHSRDISIRNELMRFVYARGIKLPLLMKRRQMEADLYFS